MPELETALLFLMEAFEADREADWCRGLQGWLGGLRDGDASKALAWPRGLLTEEIHQALVTGQDAVRRVAMASRPSSYTGGDPATQQYRAMVYAATARAVADLTATMARNSLFEVAHNSALFAHLASTLWTYRTLGRCPNDGPRLYWADLASEKTEQNVGGDFAFIVPIDDKHCKIAIIQAKREGRIDISRNVAKGATHRSIGSGFSDVSHQVRSTKEMQIDLLHAHEAKWPVDTLSGTSSVSGAWCFYVFWHRPRMDGAIPPPLVRSVRDVKSRALFGLRGMERLSSYSRVPTSTDAVDLTTFLALHLPDPKSGVGLICEGSELPGLIGIEKLDIRTLALIASPSSDWPLAYWTSLVSGSKRYVDVMPYGVERRPSAPTPDDAASSTMATGGPNRG